MSKSYQLTDSLEAPWRHSRSVFYFSLDTSFFFIDVLYTPVIDVELLPALAVTVRDDVTEAAQVFRRCHERADHPAIIARVAATSTVTQKS